VTIFSYSFPFGKMPSW